MLMRPSSEVISASSLTAFLTGDVNSVVTGARLPSAVSFTRMSRFLLGVLVSGRAPTPLGGRLFGVGNHRLARLAWREGARERPLELLAALVAAQLAGGADEALALRQLGPVVVRRTTSRRYRVAA